MRVLGVDPGSRRIGLALSDEDGIIASPLGTVQVKAREQGAREVAALAAEHQVCTIVVGLPLRLDGSEGEAVRLARWFAERLGTLTKLPIELWDERMSTLAAERALRSAGVRGSAQRGKVDRVAAALLLQSFLDAQHNKREQDEDDGYQ
jgi:putative Holliday junction resolvase